MHVTSMGVLRWTYYQDAKRKPLWLVVQERIDIQMIHYTNLLYGPLKLVCFKLSNS
jgi:hypothetical protein